MAMTHQAFEMKAPPPEAIRAALLLGLVVGENAAEDNVEMPTCEECKSQMDKLRKQFFGTPDEEAGAAPQEPEPQEPAPQT